jgi:hypothetical protein
MALGKPAAIPAKMISEIPLPRPAFGDLLAQPHQEHRSGDQCGDGDEAKHHSRVKHQARLRLDRHGYADPLKQGQSDRTVARVLRDLARPASPSFFSASSCGLAWVINCMMIDAEIYGMIPSAKIVNRDKAPPENMLNMPRMPPCCLLKSSARTCESIPGTGMCAPIRYTTRAPSRNQSRRFRSPNFPAFADRARTSCQKISPLPTRYSETLPPAASIAARAPAVAPTPLSNTFRVISPDSTTFADSTCCGTRFA